jgi:hypothetical protein
MLFAFGEKFYVSNFRGCVLVARIQVIQTIIWKPGSSPAGYYPEARLIGWVGHEARLTRYPGHANIELIADYSQVENEFLDY